jgi:hypothetical protein
MSGQIINGERWIKERLQFLRERLADGELSDGERTAIETEIEVLSTERGLTTAGFPAFPTGLLRRLRRKR